MFPGTRGPSSGREGSSPRARCLSAQHSTTSTSKNSTNNNSKGSHKSTNPTRQRECNRQALHDSSRSASASATISAAADALANHTGPDVSHDPNSRRITKTSDDAHSASAKDEGKTKYYEPRQQTRTQLGGFDSSSAEVANLPHTASAERKNSSSNHHSNNNNNNNGEEDLRRPTSASLSFFSPLTIQSSAATTAAESYGGAVGQPSSSVSRGRQRSGTGTYVVLRSSRPESARLRGAEVPTVTTVAASAKGSGTQRPTSAQTKKEGSTAASPSSSLQSRSPADIQEFKNPPGTTNTRAPPTRKAATKTALGISELWPPAHSSTREPRGSFPAGAPAPPIGQGYPVMDRAEPPLVSSSSLHSHSTTAATTANTTVMMRTPAGAGKVGSRAPIASADFKTASWRTSTTAAANGVAASNSGVTTRVGGGHSPPFSINATVPRMSADRDDINRISNKTTSHKSSGGGGFTALQTCRSVSTASPTPTSTSPTQPTQLRILLVERNRNTMNNTNNNLPHRISGAAVTAVASPPPSSTSLPQQGEEEEEVEREVEEGDGCVQTLPRAGLNSMSSSSAPMLPVTSASGSAAPPIRGGQLRLKQPLQPLQPPKRVFGGKESEFHYEDDVFAAAGATSSPTTPDGFYTTQPLTGRQGSGDSNNSAERAVGRGEAWYTATARTRSPLPRGSQRWPTHPSCTSSTGSNVKGDRKREVVATSSSSPSAAASSTVAIATTADVLPQIPGTTPLVSARRLSLDYSEAATSASSGVRRLSFSARNNNNSNNEKGNGSESPLRKVNSERSNPSNADSVRTWQELPLLQLHVVDSGSCAESLPVSKEPETEKRAVLDSGGKKPDTGSTNSSNSASVSVSSVGLVRQRSSRALLLTDEVATTTAKPTAGTDKAERHARSPPQFDQPQQLHPPRLKEGQHTASYSYRRYVNLSSTTASHHSTGTTTATTDTATAAPQLAGQTKSTVNHALGNKKTKKAGEAEEPAATEPSLGRGGIAPAHVDHYDQEEEEEKVEGRGVIEKQNGGRSFPSSASSAQPPLQPHGLRGSVDSASGGSIASSTNTTSNQNHSKSKSSNHLKSESSPVTVSPTGGKSTPSAWGNSTDAGPVRRPHDGSPFQPARQQSLSPQVSFPFAVLPSQQYPPQPQPQQRCLAESSRSVTFLSQSPLSLASGLLMASCDGVDKDNNNNNTRTMSRSSLSGTAVMSLPPLLETRSTAAFSTVGPAASGFYGSLGSFGTSSVHATAGAGRKAQHKRAGLNGKRNLTSRKNNASNALQKAINSDENVFAFASAIASATGVRQASESPIQTMSATEASLSGMNFSAQSPRRLFSPRVLPFFGGQSTSNAVGWSQDSLPSISLFQAKHHPPPQSNRQVSFMHMAPQPPVSASFSSTALLSTMPPPPSQQQQQCVATMTSLISISSMGAFVLKSDGTPPLSRSPTTTTKANGGATAAHTATTAPTGGGRADNAETEEGDADVEGEGVLNSSDGSHTRAKAGQRRVLPPTASRLCIQKQHQQPRRERTGSYVLLTMTDGRRVMVRAPPPPSIVFGEDDGFTEAFLPLLTGEGDALDGCGHHCGTTGHAAVLLQAATDGNDGPHEKEGGQDCYGDEGADWATLQVHRQVAALLRRQLVRRVGERHWRRRAAFTNFCARLVKSRGMRCFARLSRAPTPSSNETGKRTEQADDDEDEEEESGSALPASPVGWEVEADCLSVYGEVDGVSATSGDSYASSFYGPVSDTEEGAERESDVDRRRDTTVAHFYRRDPITGRRLGKRRRRCLRWHHQTQDKKNHDSSSSSSSGKPERVDGGKVKKVETAAVTHVERGRVPSPACTSVQSREEVLSDSFLFYDDVDGRALGDLHNRLRDYLGLKQGLLIPYTEHKKGDSNVNDSTLSSTESGAAKPPPVSLPVDAQGNPLPANGAISATTTMNHSNSSNNSSDVIDSLFTLVPVPPEMQARDGYHLSDYFALCPDCEPAAVLPISSSSPVSHRYTGTMFLAAAYQNPHRPVQPSQFLQELQPQQEEMDSWVASPAGFSLSTRCGPFPLRHTANSLLSVNTETSNTNNSSNADSCEDDLDDRLMLWESPREHQGNAPLTAAAAGSGGGHHRYNDFSDVEEGLLGAEGTANARGSSVLTSFADSSPWLVIKTAAAGAGERGVRGSRGSSLRTSRLPLEEAMKKEDRDSAEWTNDAFSCCSCSFCHDACGTDDCVPVEDNTRHTKKTNESTLSSSFGEQHEQRLGACVCGCGACAAHRASLPQSKRQPQHMHQQLKQQQHLKQIEEVAQSRTDITGNSNTKINTAVLRSSGSGPASSSSPFSSASYYHNSPSQRVNTTTATTTAATTASTNSTTSPSSASKLTMPNIVCIDRGDGRYSYVDPRKATRGGKLILHAVLLQEQQRLEREARGAADRASHELRTKRVESEMLSPLSSAPTWQHRRYHRSGRLLAERPAPHTRTSALRVVIRNGTGKVKREKKAKDCTVVLGENSCCPYGHDHSWDVEKEDEEEEEEGEMGSNDDGVDELFDAFERSMPGVTRGYANNATITTATAIRSSGKRQQSTDTLVLPDADEDDEEEERQEEGETASPARLVRLPARRPTLPPSASSQVRQQQRQQSWASRTKRNDHANSRREQQEQLLSSWCSSSPQYDLSRMLRTEPCQAKEDEEDVKGNRFCATRGAGRQRRDNANDEEEENEEESVVESPVSSCIPPVALVPRLNLTTAPPPPPAPQPSGATSQFSPYYSSPRTRASPSLSAFTTPRSYSYNYSCGGGSSIVWAFTPRHTHQPLEETLLSTAMSEYPLPVPPSSPLSPAPPVSRAPAGASARSYSMESVAAAAAVATRRTTESASLLSMRAVGEAQRRHGTAPTATPITKEAGEEGVAPKIVTTTAEARQRRRNSASAEDGEEEDDEYDVKKTAKGAEEVLSTKRAQTQHEETEQQQQQQQVLQVLQGEHSKSVTAAVGGGGRTSADAAAPSGAPSRPLATAAVDITSAEAVGEKKFPPRQRHRQQQQPSPSPPPPQRQRRSSYTLRPSPRFTAGRPVRGPFSDDSNSNNSSNKGGDFFSLAVFERTASQSSRPSSLQ